MSVLQNATSTGSPYQFLFGDRHTIPADPDLGVNIFPVQVVGLEGEGHLVDEAKGGDIVIEATYYGYFNEQFCRNAFRSDRAQCGKLLGNLWIGGISYGTATFAAIQMLNDRFGNGVRMDGKNGLIYCEALLRWRLH